MLGNTFTAVGYSDRALIATVVWGTVIVLALLSVALICRYPAGLPVGGPCSAVISAACHPRYEDGRRDEVHGDMVDRPLMWGVTIPGGRDIVGHCYFSSGEVAPPSNGFLYAGAIKTKPE